MFIMTFSDEFDEFTNTWVAKQACEDKWPVGKKKNKDNGCMPAILCFALLAALVLRLWL